MRCVLDRKCSHCLQLSVHLVGTLFMGDSGYAAYAAYAHRMPGEHSTKRKKSV